MGEVAKWGTLEARCSLCSSTDVEKKTESGNVLVGVTISGECRTCGREFWLQAGPPESVGVDHPIVEKRQA